MWLTDRSKREALFKQVFPMKAAENTVRTLCDFHTGRHGWSAGFTCDGGKTKLLLGPRLTPVGQQATGVKTAQSRGR